MAVKYPTPAAEELKAEFRNRYRDYIKDELPKLAEIIGAVWHLSTTSSGPAGGMGGYPGMGGMGGGMSGGMSGGMGGYPGMSPGAGMPSSPGMPMGAGMSMGPGGGMMSDMGSRSGLMARGSDSAESRVVVEWSQSNQSALQAASFNWTYPTTLQVLYAQEDLWVLRSMMLVIKATNGDADAQYNAAVKEILAIDLGASAAGIKMVGSIDLGKEMGGAGGMMGGYPGMGSAMRMGDGAPGGSPTGPESSSSSPLGGAGAEGMARYSGGGPNFMGGGQSADPADGRYVDDKMESLTGDRLRTAMASNQPTDAFLAVAKRMPVRVRFKMNVLKLPLLLCELANATLPVEVRQVRINAPAGSGAGGFGAMMSSGRGPSAMGMGASAPMGTGSGGASLSPGGGGMSLSPGGGGMSMGPGGGGMSMGPGGMSMGPGGGYPGMPSGGGYPGMRAQGAAASDSPYDATVEIYGLIYIYNPVDLAKLGLEDETATAAGDAATAANGEDNADNGLTSDTGAAAGSTDEPPATTPAQPVSGVPAAEEPAGAATPPAVTPDAATPVPPDAATTPADPATDPTDPATATDPAGTGGGP